MSFLFESPVKTPEELPSMKYYPIFDKRWSTTTKSKDQLNNKSNKKSNSEKIKRQRSSRLSNRTRPYPRKNLFKSDEQYCLDFGQKNFDAQRCNVCNMLYTVGEIVDEKTHEEYHDTFVNSLKYREWKNEDIINRFEDGKILRVLPTSPHYMHKKIDELFKVADIELGIYTDLKSSMKTTSVYLIFISIPSKRISGFVSAERVNAANKLLSENPLMATIDEYPAECGVSRIWTHPNFRRKKIATRLLDTLRSAFYENKIIAKEKLAFSDPTIVGKDFAINYTGSRQFLIYMYRHVVEETKSNLIDNDDDNNTNK